MNMSTAHQQHEPSGDEIEPIRVPVFTLENLSDLAASHPASTSRSVDIEVGTNTATLQPAPAPGVSGSQTALIVIHCEMDGEQAQLFLPQNVFKNCIAEFYPAVRRMPFDPHLAVLLFEVGLADAIGELESQLGTTIEFNRAEFLVHGLEKDGANIAFAVKWNDQPAAIVRACVPDHVAYRLGEAWLTHHQGDNASASDIAVSVRVGVSEVTEHELLHLTPGDVVTFGSTSLHNKHALLIADEIISLPISLESDQPTIADQFSSLGLGSHSKMKVTPEGTLPPGCHALCAEIIRTHVPISTLEAMSLGEPFELPASPLESIDLYCGDTLIAQGNIVFAGDLLGVQLTRTIHND